MEIGCKGSRPCICLQPEFSAGKTFLHEGGERASECIAILVTREAWLKLVKKVARLEVNADFSVDSIPGGSGVVSDDDRLVVRLETHQRPPAAKPHSDSALEAKYPGTAHLLYHAEHSPAEVAANSLEQFQKKSSRRAPPLQVMHLLCINSVLKQNILKFYQSIQQALPSKTPSLY